MIRPVGWHTEVDIHFEPQQGHALSSSESAENILRSIRTDTRPQKITEGTKGIQDARAVKVQEHGRAENHRGGTAQQRHSRNVLRNKGKRFEADPQRRICTSTRNPDNVLQSLSLAAVPKGVIV